MSAEHGLKGPTGGHGPGLKHDGGKVRTDLLPVRALLSVAEVMTFGASKYGANNWQNVRPRSRYFGAALRHLFARALGERHDPETGLPHLAHASCCVLFMLSGDLGHDPVDALEALEAPTFPLGTRPAARREAFIPHPDHTSGAV